MKFWVSFMPGQTIQNYCPDFEESMKCMYENKCAGPVTYPAILHTETQITEWIIFTEETNVTVDVKCTF